MPSCNNPTRYSMPESNKIGLVNLLGERGIPLIEDDALGELHHQNGVFPAKAFDKHDNVLYCSSFSKTLTPGFRIGWVSAGKNHAALEKLKFGSKISTNSVLQDAIGRFLKSGQYDKHLRKMRLSIQSQMLRYLGAISDCFPGGTKLSVPHGGEVYGLLPQGTDAFALQKMRWKKELAFVGGTFFQLPIFIITTSGSIFVRFGVQKLRKALRRLLS